MQSIKLRFWNELLNIELKLDDVDTIGGFVYSKLETQPQLNQKIQYENYEFVITKCSKQRIIKLSVNAVNKKEWRFI